jgi:hypothetical protein
MAESPLRSEVRGTERTLRNRNALGRQEKLCYPEHSIRAFLGVPECVSSGRSAAWLARLVRDQEAGGSNPLAPTILYLQGKRLTVASVTIQCS